MAGKGEEGFFALRPDWKSKGAISGKQMSVTLASE